MLPPKVPVPVVVKVMALENIATSLEEIQSEVKAMKLNRHENVLSLYCCFVVGSDLWLVMPLMDKGSCYYILRCLRKSGRIAEGHGVPEDVIATVVRELLHVLEAKEVRALGSEQSRKVDVRIVAASNRPLAGEVAAVNTIHCASLASITRGAMPWLSARTTIERPSAVSSANDPSCAASASSSSAG